ncbi:CTP synthase [Candidatus Pelagibacter communis]|uniref:CTP synthase n=1 Tax=Pelagibacter ubique TaxID=198252 RepID=UPI00094D0E6D|nr:CTP synthase [Candidatus Pelagibacter ubique]
MARYIFVTGGVVSSLGKGLSSASLAYLLKSQGYKVRIRKMDPYLNVDPGTMSPFQHGEVFVTDDGAETDLDLGHYERFTNISSKKSDNITTGRIYSDVIKKERQGGYLGKTVQVIPHITDRIKEFIKKDITNEDFVICEIGGTVGDIESLPFVEAIRQFANEQGKSKTLFIHLTFVPFLKSSDEIKTKPTQHSVKELRSIGIQPDIIICRSQQSIPLDQKKKISLFCNVPIDNVIETVDVRTIYEAPISFYNQKLDKQVLKYFKIKSRKKPDLTPWKKITNITLNTKKSIDIAIIGKYVNLKDAYKSLDEALIHGGIANKVKVNLIRIESDKLKTNQIKDKLKNISGLLIPGGFGKRGTEGKIYAIKFARENKIPFLGICFGMQMATIEFARNELKIKKAGSSELDKNCFPVIGLIDEWNKNGKIIKGTDKKLGGTMRLGLYEARLRNNSAIKKIYKSSSINERHRHRYEVNNNLKNEFERKGLIFSGMSPDKNLPEIIELRNHPWFIGVQFHPEFKSRPLAPHPLFSSFIKAAKNHK